MTSVTHILKARNGRDNKVPNRNDLAWHDSRNLTKNYVKCRQILDAHGSEAEHDCCSVQSGTSLPTFQKWPMPSLWRSPKTQ
jgi:hypothetical protein